jgi:hypothetical protein
MINTILRNSLIILSLLILAACGGGGGQRVGSSGVTTTNATATVKINLSGNLGGKAVAGAGFTLTLPANVTPAMTGSDVATGVVTPSGAFAGTSITPIVTYTPATGSVFGTMKILVTSSASSGVATVGEVVTITLQLANGAAPAAGNFTVENGSVMVIDTLGASLTGMSASVAGVTLQ